MRHRKYYRSREMKRERTSFQETTDLPCETRMLKLASRFPDRLRKMAVILDHLVLDHRSLARYNNRDRFVSSSFIYKRSAGPKPTEINFGRKKRYRAVPSPLLSFRCRSPPLFSLINHYSLLISRRESGLQLSKPPLPLPTFSVLSLLPSFLFLRPVIPRSPSPGLTRLPHSIVFRQLVEILSARNNFTTTVPSITGRRRGRVVDAPAVTHPRSIGDQRDPTCETCRNEGIGDALSPAGKRFLPRERDGAATRQRKK